MKDLVVKLRLNTNEFMEAIMKLFVPQVISVGHSGWIVLRLRYGVARWGKEKG